MGSPDEIVVRNVRWLAGYRHPRHLVGPVTSGLREVFAKPHPLMDGAGLAGDPIAVLPVLFHLLWSQELVVDVSAPLHAAAMVSAGVR